MRFLQIEWHNHERARNAWDIERAEMKARIAKQEGDCRSSRKMNESLDKQIRMLERALRIERAKNKTAAAGEKVPTEEEVKRDWNGRIGLKSDLKSGWSCSCARTKALLILVTTLETPSFNTDVASDSPNAYRDRSKQFLQKCVEELTYLLTPPAQPLPPHRHSPSASHGAPFNTSSEMQVSMEEVLAQQQLHHQKRRPNPNMSSQLPSLPNHQPPQSVSASNNYSDQAQLPHALQHPTNSRDYPQSQPSFHVQSDGTDGHFRSDINTHHRLEEVEEPIETVTHSFDAYGHPIEHRNQVTIHDNMRDEDSWNFDDLEDQRQTSLEVPQVRRPDTDVFPHAGTASSRSPTRPSPGSHRRRSSGMGSITRRRSEGSRDGRRDSSTGSNKQEAANFKVRFALRGHLDVVRSVIFTGGGSPSEPEICTTGDDGMIKRWIIPGSYTNFGANQEYQQAGDLDIQSYFTHRGHDGIVTSLAAYPGLVFSTGGRAAGDGWIFSGGQDATVRVWERGRVDPKATLDGHTDAVWTVCVLPALGSAVFGHEATNAIGGGEGILLASGSADGTVKIWAVSTPPQFNSPQSQVGGARRGIGGGRRHSVTSGSGFPSSPQPSVASDVPFHYTLIHSIDWTRSTPASPTCISPLGSLGENFVVSYSDSSVVVYDTRTGEEVIGMASSETYNGTPATGVNSVVVTSSNVGTYDSAGAISLSLDSGRGVAEEEVVVHGATGNSKTGGIEGVIISGHEDRYVRFFDANSGELTN